MPDVTLDPTADDPKLLALVVDYYHRTLTNSSEALTYLQGRGVSNGQAIERFRIGYADRSLGNKLPEKVLKPGRTIRARLHQLGLYRDTGHEHFAGCVVFPIFAADGTGQLVDLYGRKMLAGRLRQGTPLDMYLHPERRGVWNVEAFTASDEVVLCPSVLDALTLWCHGYRNVTCTFGPDALTADHLAAFVEFKVQRVIVVAESLAPRLLDAGLECFQLKLPPNLSIETYAAQTTDPADALGGLLRKAEWLGKGSAPSLASAPRTAAPSMEPVEAEDVVADDADDDPELLDDAADDEELLGAAVADDATEETTEPALAVTPAEPVIRTDSPLPPAPQDTEAEVEGDEVRLVFGNRRYRIRGLGKNLSFDQLKVNVLVNNGTGMFVDTFDLYAARHRKAYVHQAAAELHVEEQTVKKDLGQVLLKLEELQDQLIAATLAPKDTTPVMTDEEKAEALRLLKDPQLLDRITGDFTIVGEPTNKLIGYLAAVSRKLDEPLAVIIQSSTAAGKSSLMDAVLAFVPPEDLVQFSALTGQALYYLGANDLKHKVLAVVEEAGAQRAAYALKLLQSEGALTIASTGKEASTGRLVTQVYKVEGPVAIFLTTTSAQVDEELLNRCLVLTVDEARAQTQAIHQAQRHRQTLVGLLARQDRQQILARHRNAQRLLKPLLVTNPYAEQLTFLDDRTRTRRDHAKYLTLIRTITLLHQHQRPVRTIEHQGRQLEYIDVALEDIDIANKLANEVLGRSLDELPPQTRRLRALIDSMVTAACQQQGVDRADYRFSRRDVREHTGWGHSQLAIHLKRLEELEHLLAHRGQRGRSFVYELVSEGPKDEPSFLARLLDVQQLRCNGRAKFPG